MHTLIDWERKIQVFAFIEYEEEEMGEEFVIKVMNRCARDAKQSSKSGYDSSGKRNFFVTEN